jgi:hypothetical protein
MIFTALLTGLSGLLRAGEYGASFLEIGIGARALGMGGAFGSVADDGTAFYWNPAGLALSEKNQISGMYGPQFGTIEHPLANYHYLGYAQHLPGGATIAFNWIRLAVDDIPIYSELMGTRSERYRNGTLRPTGEAEGYFSDTEDAFFFSFAKMNRFDADLGWVYHPVRIDIPIGINIKWIRQTLGDGEASGLGLDAGAMVRFHLDEFFEIPKFGMVSLGMHFQDITKTTLSWNTKHKDTVPANLKLSVSYAIDFFQPNHVIIVGYDHDSRWRGKDHFGVEYCAFRHLNLRAGLEQKQFTGGAGFSVWIFSVDYAFITHEFDALHRISCSISF